MNQPDNILNELRELSPTVAGINRVNVFTVPDGYFESIAGLLLMTIAEDAGEQSRKPQHLSVPEGYFENLAGNILDRVKLETAVAMPNETADISALVAGIKNKNVYSVPAGYFTDLPAKIMAAVAVSKDSVATETADISSLVAGIGNKNVYSLPAGYFTSFADELLAQLNTGSEVQQETASLSTLVAAIGNKNIYIVPQGYFEGFASDVTQNLAPAAKVISMKSRFSVLKYAAAAVVTGVIAISAFFMLNNNNAPDKTQVAVMTEANQIIKNNSFDKEMNSISDAAIVAFLETKGQNVEASLVASLADDKDLPDADEYLLNDNTLDEILNSLDLNN